MVDGTLQGPDTETTYWLEQQSCDWAPMSWEVDRVELQVPHIPKEPNGEDRN